MPKSHHFHKDIKKQPLMTPKEKRAAKRAKKHMHEVQPLVTPDNTHH